MEFWDNVLSLVCAVIFVWALRLIYKKMTQDVKKPRGPKDL